MSGKKSIADQFEELGEILVKEEGLNFDIECISDDYNKFDLIKKKSSERSKNNDLSKHENKNSINKIDEKKNEIKKTENKKDKKKKQKNTKNKPKIEEPEEDFDSLCLVFDDSENSNSVACDSVKNSFTEKVDTLNEDIKKNDSFKEKNILENLENKSSISKKEKIDFKDNLKIEKKNNSIKSDESILNEDLNNKSNKKNDKKSDNTKLNTEEKKDVDLIEKKPTRNKRNNETMKSDLILPDNKKRKCTQQTNDLLSFVKPVNVPKLGLKLGLSRRVSLKNSLHPELFKNET